MIIWGIALILILNILISMRWYLEREPPRQAYRAQSWVETRAEDPTLVTYAAVVATLPSSIRPTFEATWNDSTYLRWTRNDWEQWARALERIQR